jgi:subtilisin family serine protease
MKLIARGVLIAVAVSALALVVSGAPDGRVAVLIGFKELPDAALVRAHGGAAKAVFDIVPVVAATVPQSALAGLQRNPKVEYVEEDRTLFAIYDPATETLPWGIARIGAPSVWLGGNTGAGVRVAVLDTGIDASHPDLAANYTLGYDFYRKDAVPNDENGHGTHVAGIIAALDDGPNYGGSNAGTSVVGVGPQIDLLIAKFLGPSGSGSTSNEISAIQWAVNNGTRVISMSYGSYYRSRTEEEALQNAYSRGVYLVAAAGNDGAPWKLYPAAYKSVVSVAATNSSNLRASFSNYNNDVELAAPGVAILSTMPTYVAWLNTQYGLATTYEYLSGTSMACPHVSGTAGLVIWKYPGWSADQVRNRLNSTATDLGPAGRDSYYGYGLVNAAAAAQ